MVLYYSVDSANTTLRYVHIDKIYSFLIGKNEHNSDSSCSCLGTLVIKKTNMRQILVNQPTKTKKLQ